MYGEDDFQGFRCVCGEMVVAMHRECRGLLTPEELREFQKGRRRRDDW